MSVDPEHEAEQDAEQEQDWAADGAQEWPPELQRPRRPVSHGKRRATPVEQHLWRHSLESAVLAVFGIILAGAVLPHGWPLALIAAGGAVLAGVMWFTSLYSTGSLVMANYLLAWGVLVTAWLTAVHVLGKPWHVGLIFALVIPALILAPLGALAIGHHREQIRRDAEEYEAKQNTAPLRRWEARLARLGVPNVTILDVVDVGGGNKQVIGRLGRAVDGARVSTLEQLKQLSVPIAVHLRLAEDDVHISRPKGGSAADFIIHVRQRNTGKRADVVLPAENRPRTINRPIPLGVMDNGRPFELLYREVAVLIIGVRGSGKSNLINVFIAQLARCIDAVVFMIDLKGGRAARPWMIPWVQHNAPRPVIDWLATTREEANIMLDALMAGGQARARSGEGWEKITPSADTPAIILVVDETAVMTGHNIRADGLSNFTLAQKLAQLTETFRSEAIDPLVAALRGNVDIMGSSAVKAMTEVRFGLRVTQATDGDMIFPDDHHAAKALARLRDAGDCLVKVGPDLSDPVHLYRIGGEEQITNIAISTGTLRPEPEQRMQEAMGAAYAERWTRPHGATLKQEWRQSVGMPEPPDHGDDPDFWSIVGTVDDPERPKDPRWVRIRQLLRQRGPAGYTVGRLVTLLAQEGLTTPRETIQRWLAKDESEGLVRRTGKPTHKWVWHAGDIDPADLPGMPDD